MNFTPGHLDKNSEAKINTVEITNGNMIFSEKSGLQFIDYADKRHTYGSVLSGVYNATGFVDFATSTLHEAVDAISKNGLVPNGQIIKVGNTIYRYRYFESLDADIITTIDDDYISVNEDKIGYLIHLPEYEEGDMINIDLLVSVTNEEHGHKMYLIKVVNNEIDYASCKDLDGSTITEDSLDLYMALEENLFCFALVYESSFKVISYSLTSSGSDKNEGLYVVADA